MQKAVANTPPDPAIYLAAALSPAMQSQKRIISIETKVLIKSRLVITELIMGAFIQLSMRTNVRVLTIDATEAQKTNSTEKKTFPG